MKALILSLLLTYSCTRYSSLTKEGAGIRIDDIFMDITYLEEIPWTVGNKKEAEVTQSFAFILELPRLKKEDLDYLVKEKGVDAWVIRLIQQRGSTVNDLGSLYTPFQPKNLTRRTTAEAAKTASIKIYYAASFPSQRFRHFNCPAFGHNKQITTLTVKGEEEAFDISLGQTTSYGEKPYLAEMTPLAFNGGNDLKGEYYLEIAPYNSQKKILLSSFKRIPRFIEILSEEAKFIPSCQGVHPEREL